MTTNDDCTCYAHCPQCGERYTCKRNDVWVAVVNNDGECIGIWSADRFGCSCGTWLQGFGRGPVIGINNPDLAAQLSSGLVDEKRAACPQCQRQPYEESDGTFCSPSCREEAIRDLNEQHGPALTGRELE